MSLFFSTVEDLVRGLAPGYHSQASWNMSLISTGEAPFSAKGLRWVQVTWKICENI